MESAPEHRLKITAALAAITAAGLVAVGANKGIGRGEPSGPRIPKAQDCLAGVDPNWTEADIYPGDLIADPYWVAMRARHRWKMSVSPDGSGVALGDSMFDYSDMSGIPHLVKLSIGGETLRKLMLRLYDKDSKGKPGLWHRAGYLMCLTGINDAIDIRNGATQPEAAATMAGIFDKLVARTSGPLILYCPWMVNAEKFSTPSNAEYVAPLARHIMTAYRHLKRVETIDLNPIVAPRGTLLAEFDRGDGQHPSLKAQELIVETGYRSTRRLGVY